MEAKKKKINELFILCAFTREWKCLVENANILVLQWKAFWRWGYPEKGPHFQNHSSTTSHLMLTEHAIIGFNTSPNTLLSNI